ncbi:hypothetical protein [Streptomyces sp. LN245]
MQTSAGNDSVVGFIGIRVDAARLVPDGCIRAANGVDDHPES